MDKIKLAFTSALEQAELIRKGEVSPLELTQLYLDRIQKYNEELGSYYTVAAEMALAEATAKTEAFAQTSDKTSLPPFFGVPTAVKDLNPVAGLPCTYGVASLKNNIMSYDDGVVVRMKQAGFTILGKTAASQIGSFPYTEPPGFPPTRNPWNLNHTSGGSSGGSAAAVAAGLCPIAQGTDGGGSIRIPAACCGLVGLKPARGRVSNAPVGDYQSGIATQGGLARTVADAAAFLDVISGYTTGDPYWLPNPEMSFFAATGHTLPQLRIAFATSIPPIGTAARVYQQAVQETAQNLAAMGHIIEEVCPHLEELIAPFVRVWQAGVPASGIPLEAFSPIHRWLAEQSGTAGEYLLAVSKMQMIARQIVAFFDNFDALVLPVYMHPPMKVGEWADLSFEETIDKIINWVAPCPMANASGLPAIALPVGFDSEGLPIAVQLIGKPADEITIIALAAKLEAINPCFHKHPANFA